MFKAASDNPNRIESDEGFSVEILGRGGLRYRERGRELRIDSEFLVLGAQYDMVVYARTIRGWDPPHEAEPIDDADRALILDNVRRALASRGLKIDVDR